MAVNVLEMTVQNIEAAALCQAICEENTEQRDSNGIEAWMVKHCLESFSEEDTDLPPGIDKNTFIASLVQVRSKSALRRLKLLSLLLVERV